MEFKEKLIFAARQINIKITEEQAVLFEKYKENLLNWNKVMNLTAVTDEDEIITKHFVDSLTCCKYIENENKIVDVGTGAGFPGLPLKIVFGDKMDLLLVDSLAKRLKFLDNTICQLKLTNIKTIHGRAEDMGNDKKHREKYDMVLSRAVAKLSVLAEYCIPLIKVQGRMIGMKGAEPEEEINNAKATIEKMGGEIGKTEKIKLPMSDIAHSIIVIKKTRCTPEPYPRKQSKIEKNPIQ